jgi:dihydrodipicolinate synthase/N-acetylneuraminate lyase
MLTRENCKGIWAAIPMSWDEEYRFDIVTFKENVRKMAEAGAHCLYTSGSTGEFYAINFEEFKDMVDALVEATSDYNVFTAVGTTALNTAEVINMVEYCVYKKVDCVMPAFPCWLHPKDEECLQFLKDVCNVSEDIAVLHYNHIRTKRLFNGDDYKETVKLLPENFIGSKSGMPDFMYYADLRNKTPELVHLSSEQMVVPSMMIGAKGFVTVLYNMNPRLIVDLYNFCENKEWDKAMQLQLRICNFTIDVGYPVWNLGYYDPAIDNAFMCVGGFLKIARRIRKPYNPVPSELVRKMKETTEEKYPEFIYNSDF